MTASKTPPMSDLFSAAHERLLARLAEHVTDVRVIAALCERVVTVGRSRDHAERATRGLRHAGITNVAAVVAEPRRAASEHGPFDAIVLAGAEPMSPHSDLAAHLVEGGRLLTPLAAGRRMLITYRRDGNRPVRLLPLTPSMRLA